MGNASSTSLPLTFTIAFLCCATAAAADPIRVTSGFVDAGGAIGQPWDAEDLHVEGARFTINSSLEDQVAFVRLSTTPTVTPGALVDLSGVLRVEDTIGAFLDQSFALLAAPFEMSFTTPAARLACSRSPTLLDCVAVAPFRFEAALTFTPLDGSSVTHRLVGSGRAEGRLLRQGSFQGGGVTYFFEPSPVPEPATLSLFAAGAIVVGRRAWRRRSSGRLP